MMAAACAAIRETRPAMIPIGMTAATAMNMIGVMIGAMIGDTIAIMTEVMIGAGLK